MTTKNPFVQRVLIIKSRKELNEFVEAYGWERFNAKLASVKASEYESIYEHFLHLAEGQIPGIEVSE